ncbi:RNA recognition motif domain-containing protein [Ditylenchus destructor]|nr:RNA recognition motif domain-containing protein [Ditylenchus destructor]
MSAIRNILQRCVRNASILGRSQLRLQHSGNFCPIYSEPTYISRKAYSNTVNEAAENATHSAQESPFGKTDSVTTEPKNILEDQKSSSKTSVSNKNLNLRKYYICVRDLSKETTPESLREFYSQFGEIASCFIIFQGKPNQLGSKTRALNSSPHCVDGKEIKTTLGTPVKKQLTLKVTDLSPKTTIESLKVFYSKFGWLNRCKIHKNTTEIGHVGEVTFAYQKDMNRALDAQPHVIDGSEVFLKYATYDLDLYIRKMPEDTTEETLRAFYSKYGQLRQCRLVKEKTGMSHAFVSYSAIDEVNRAMDDRPHLIDGKPLLLKVINERSVYHSLFVGSLPENVTGETLREEFSKYGKLVFWELQKDGRFNQSRCGIAYGIVSYGSEEEALKALNSGPHTIEGVVVDVRKSRGFAQGSNEKSDN